MELVSKLEKRIAKWVKGVPHLPVGGQKWLAENVWWIVLIGAIITGISVLLSIGGLFTTIALLGAANSTVYGYYAVQTVSGWTVVTTIVNMVFLIGVGLLLAVAVNPLKLLKKKGWVLLFLAWLLQAVSIIIGAVISLNILVFIVTIIFGAIGLAVSGYFIFEIHGQFAKPESTKKPKKA